MEDGVDLLSSDCLLAATAAATRRSALEDRLEAGRRERAHRDVLAACPRGQLRRVARQVAAEQPSPRVVRWCSDWGGGCAGEVAMRSESMRVMRVVGLLLLGLSVPVGADAGAQEPA